MTAEELAVVTTAGGGLAWFMRWAVALWATVRREEVEASKAIAAERRAEGERMIEALLAQARSNAELGGKLDKLTLKIDTLVEWRERTPVEGVPIPRDDAFTSDRPSSERDVRRRLRTVPQGHRVPKSDRDE